MLKFHDFNYLGMFWCQSIFNTFNFVIIVLNTRIRFELYAVLCERSSDSLLSLQQWCVTTGSSCVCVCVCVCVWACLCGL